MVIFLFKFHYFPFGWLYSRVEGCVVFLIVDPSLYILLSWAGAIPGFLKNEHFLILIRIIPTPKLYHIPSLYP